MPRVVAGTLDLLPHMAAGTHFAASLVEHMTQHLLLAFVIEPWGSPKHGKSRDIKKVLPGKVVRLGLVMEILQMSIFSLFCILGI